MKIKDRIKEFRRVKSNELAPNPKNWRTHPKEQKEALQGLLAEIGFAGAVLARETPEGLMLIDGHLRTETANDSEIPVLILDVTEDEADKILVTFDPISVMATADSNALDKLLRDVQTSNEAVANMLTNLSERVGVIPTDTQKIQNLMDGLPEYEMEDITSYRSIIVHFADKQAVDDFAKLIGQKITEKTRYLHIPYQEPIDGKEFTVESKES